MSWTLNSTVAEVRREFLLKYADGVAVDDLCESFGVRRSTAYKYIARFKTEGIEAAIAERSRAPRNVARLSEETVERVLTLRHQTRWGPRKLEQLFVTCFGENTAPSRASIANVLRDYGLARDYRRRRGVPTTELTNALRPNDVWSADHKGKM